MRAQLGLVVVVLSCGGKSPPAPVLANTTKTAPSCGEAGVILRGPVGDDAKAGRAREAAIANACELDHWSAEVIACVAGSANPQLCLDKLPAPLRKSYDDKLAAWAEQYGGSSYGGDTYGDAVIGGGTGDLAPEIACEDAAGDVASYPPAVALTDVDRDWAVTLRKRAVVGACNDTSWDPAVKYCMVNTPPVADCLAKLDDLTRKQLATSLAEADALATHTAAVRKKPASFDCKKVVAAHYADATWKDKLDPKLKPAERKKLIADSRDAMTKACKAEAWSDSVRACLVAGGDNTCYLAGGIAGGMWGYPAARVAGFTPSGIPECDAYGSAILKLARCDKMPQEARDALFQAYQQASNGWGNLPADQKPALAQACKAGEDAIKQSASVMCP